MPWMVFPNIYSKRWGRRRQQERARIEKESRRAVERMGYTARCDDLKLSKFSKLIRKIFNIQQLIMYKN
jgi:hypothetical protein